MSFPWRADGMSIEAWRGKRVCFLGDSITDGVGVTRGERYLDLLADMTGIEAVGMGVNGAQLSGVRKQAERVFETYGDAVDAIFVFAGTNDFYGNIPIGEWFCEHRETVTVLRDDDGNSIGAEDRRVREFCMDGATVRGRLNRLMLYLRQKYASKPVILMTPIHRAYATFSNHNIQYSELYANSLGVFFEDYVSAVREAADIWSAPLIDLYRESGLCPLVDESAAEFFVDTERDRLHLNPAGHRRLAAVIAGHMRNMGSF